MRVCTMHMYTWWGGQSWTKLFFFSMYRPPSLIEAVSSTEMCWLLYIGLLVALRFNVGAIFPHDGLQPAKECAAGLADISTASQSHSVAIMDTEQPDWCEALLGLLPAECSRSLQI